MTLPSVYLPQNNGRYEDWPGFADQFRTTIHENVKRRKKHAVQLRDGKKLTYVCGYKEPAKSIKSFANYLANYQYA